MEKTAHVEDYMVKDVVSVPKDFSIEETTEKLISTEFHGLPVVEEDHHLVGFVTAKELLRAADNPEQRVGNVIRSGTITVSPHMSIDDAARIIFRYSLRNLPVVDESNKLVGIISNIDILRSQIEKATPSKVSMVKTFLEARHDVSISVRRRVIPIGSLRPTQHEVYADEFRGRKHEIKRGLVEPIIVIQKNDHFVLVDGHHRVLAAKDMGVRQFSAFVLELSSDVVLGMEESANECGLKTLDDVKIIEGSRHPLMEVATRLLRDEG